MTHLAHEDGHSRTFVAVIQREFHLISLGIERHDVVVELVAGDKESLQLPFYAHKKHALHLIYILIEVDNVAFVVGYKLGHF